MACNFTFISSDVFPSKNRNRITDRYCSFSMIANEHTLAHFKQLSKQNYSINLSEILTGVVSKVALNDSKQTLSQWCYQSLNTGTYHTPLVDKFCLTYPTSPSPNFQDKIANFGTNCFFVY